MPIRLWSTVVSQPARPPASSPALAWRVAAVTAIAVSVTGSRTEQTKDAPEAPADARPKAERAAAGMEDAGLRRSSARSLQTGEVGDERRHLCVGQLEIRHQRARLDRRRVLQPAAEILGRVGKDAAADRLPRREVGE